MVPELPWSLNQSWFGQAHTATPILDVKSFLSFLPEAQCTARCKVRRFAVRYKLPHPEPQTRALHARNFDNSWFRQVETAKPMFNVESFLACVPEVRRTSRCRVRGVKTRYNVPPLKVHTSVFDVPVLW